MSTSSATVPKPKIILSPDTIEKIERILTLDETAKITRTKYGVTVYSEKLKKEYTQS